jgi:hypothetical protein
VKLQRLAAASHNTFRTSINTRNEFAYSGVATTARRLSAH